MISSVKKVQLIVQATARYLHRAAGFQTTDQHCEEVDYLNVTSAQVGPFLSYFPYYSWASGYGWSVTENIVLNVIPWGTPDEKSLRDQSPK